MKTHILFFFTLVLFCCGSCSQVGPGEHGFLAFENNSSNTIYVRLASISEIRSPSLFVMGSPKESCGIAPGSTKEVLTPGSSGVPYSYEDVLSKPGSKKYVIVVPFYPDKDHPITQPLYYYKLVCYELTLEDLQALDFHLYYPPNETMANIPMDPPYKTFVTEP